MIRKKEREKKSASSRQFHYFAVDEKTCAFDLNKETKKKIGSATSSVDRQQKIVAITTAGYCLFYRCHKVAVLSCVWVLSRNGQRQPVVGGREQRTREWLTALFAQCVPSSIGTPTARTILSTFCASRVSSCHS